MMIDTRDSLKTNILKILRGSEGYVSGQSICSELNVSRTAVWKYINQLKEEGYLIEAISNKGYKISQYPDSVTESEIKSVVEGEFFASEVVYFEETDSTNTQAKRLAENGAAHGTLVIAESQNSGRGRRGKQWSSPKDSGIWMTLIVRPDIKPYSASMLTLIAGMAAVDAIHENYETECFIKWPNDIVMNRKKICGILTEMSAEPDLINYVVTGIGINVNITEIDESLSETATSLLLETEKKVRRSNIIKSFANAYEKYFNIFLETEDMSVLMSEYNKYMVNTGRDVRVLGVKKEFTGMAEGINARGELLVRTGDGSLAEIMAGEVSVRGLYGYV